MMSFRSKLLGLLLISTVALIGIQIYFVNRHCQFSSSDSVSMSTAGTANPYDSKFDPCYIDRPMSAGEKVLPITLVIVLGLSFLSGITDIRAQSDRRNNLDG
jgi:ABC-type cobalt transport system substrate-binding protein